MTLTTHSVIGAGIGVGLGNPVLGFILGFISHFMVDMIPHGDHYLSHELRVEKKKKKAVTYGSVDAMIAIMTLMFLFNVVDYNSKTVFTAAIAGSIAPDLLVGIHDLTKSKYLRWFNTLHFFFHDFFVHKYGDVKLRYALAGQAGFIVILLNILQ